MLPDSSRVTLTRPLVFPSATMTRLGNDAPPSLDSERLTVGSLFFAENQPTAT